MNTPHILRLITAGALLSVFAAGPAPAAIAADEHGFAVVTESYSVSPRQALPGGTVTVKVTCLFEGAPCTSLLVGLYSKTDNTIETGEHDLGLLRNPFDSRGRFERVFTIPADVPPGEYDFGLSAGADDQALGSNDFAFTVLDPHGDRLATTGYRPSERKTLAASALAILLGGALILRERRRRTRSDFRRRTTPASLP